jgi:hypothetical protein
VGDRDHADGPGWIIRIGLCLLALAAASALAGTAHAQTVGGTCDERSPSASPCTGAEKLAEAAAAECRRLGLPEEQCKVPLGREVSGQIASAHLGTWLHRAAAFQYRLADRLPLLRSQWLGTHNSFNSASAPPTASHTDSNQQLSLRQQLEVDMRALELDLHFIPSLAAGGGNAVVVCHGRGPDEADFGCTDEPRFSEVLPEIRGWLNEHPRQVVLLYLEDALGDPAGYAETVSVLDSGLKRPDGSSLIYRPSPSEMTEKGCANLPLGISRDDVRARGAQVVLVGNCRSGWAADVYGWDDNHVESGSTPEYRPFPACDKTYPRAIYDSKFVRYYEDSTFVSTAVDPSQSPEQAEAQALTPERVASMTRCGVNLFGFDQLLPNDGRIEASIWSWVRGQPDAAGGRCGLQRADGRWVTRPCKHRHRAACRAASGGWTLTSRAVRYSRARSACRARQAGFGIPRNGYENSQLRQVAGKQRVWLRYRLH